MYVLFVLLFLLLIYKFSDMGRARQHQHLCSDLCVLYCTMYTLRGYPNPNCNYSKYCMVGCVLRVFTLQYFYYGNPKYTVQYTYSTVYSIL